MSKDIFDLTSRLENLESTEKKMNAFVVKVRDPKANEKSKCGTKTTVMERHAEFPKEMDWDWCQSGDPTLHLRPGPSRHEVLTQQRPST
ncbi:hypothetical protein PoB_005097800 [Plakobranchus ocellatus]|uniref:Uncharacterized protein n=1 Tax=Plakobranchus ocellatus TaxID=259542 RepID=A0AAV4BXV9_9GAST|nr:hypothetical protein PoB_005097800 [Plakobranchus ocellatus]